MSLGQLKLWVEASIEFFQITGMVLIAVLVAVSFGYAVLSKIQSVRLSEKG